MTGGSRTHLEQSCEAFLLNEETYLYATDRSN
jgi:hypothetical protein